MRHRIGMAVVCQHISAVLYLLVAALVLLLLTDDEAGLGWPLATGSALFCVALTGGVEVVVYGIHRRKFWAWVAGLCLFGLYLTSLFLPVGAFGLWGLLDERSRAEFGVGNGNDRA